MGQRRAITGLLALIVTLLAMGVVVAQSPHPLPAQQSLQSSPAQQPSLPVRIIDTEKLISTDGPWVAERGQPFVLKNVRLRMEDTRYVDGHLPSSVDQENQIQIFVHDFDDPDLLSLIKSKCSTVGVHDEARKKSIQQDEACRVNLFGKFEWRYDRTYPIPKIPLLSGGGSGRSYTYYFVNIRRATPEEINPSATPVTAQELRSNGYKYIGKWVSMSNAIVRGSGLTLTIDIGGGNVVQTWEPHLEHHIMEHVQKRCYNDIEYKDIYKPEECTFNVKFRVIRINEKDASDTDIFAAALGHKKGDVIADNFTFLTSASSSTGATR